MPSRVQPVLAALLQCLALGSDCRPSWQTVHHSHVAVALQWPPPATSAPYTPSSPIVFHLSNGRVLFAFLSPAALTSPPGRCFRRPGRWVFSDSLTSLQSFAFRAPPTVVSGLLPVPNLNPWCSRQLCSLAYNCLRHTATQMYIKLAFLYFLWPMLGAPISTNDRKTVGYYLDLPKKANSVSYSLKHSFLGFLKLFCISLSLLFSGCNIPGCQGSISIFLMDGPLPACSSLLWCGWAVSGCPALLSLEMWLPPHGLWGQCAGTCCWISRSLTFASTDEMATFSGLIFSPQASPVPPVLSASPRPPTRACMISWIPCQGRGGIRALSENHFGGSTNLEGICKQGGKGF